MALSQSELRSASIRANVSGAGVAEADVSAKISDLVTAKTKQLKIKVNPRYGTWDDASGDILAVDSAGGAVTSPATE